MHMARQAHNLDSKLIVSSVVHCEQKCNRSASKTEADRCDSRDQAASQASGSDLRGLLQEREDVRRDSSWRFPTPSCPIAPGFARCVRFALSRGEVGVLDVALGRGEIGHRIGQRRDVAVERGRLEGAELAAERGHAVQRRLNDLAGLRRIGRQRGILARTDLDTSRPTVPPSEPVSTLWMPRSGPAGAEVTVGAELEQGAAAGDVEIDILAGSDWVGSKAAEKAKLGVFSETVLPWPVAATPFTVAAMSVPVAFVRRRATCRTCRPCLR